MKSFSFTNNVSKNQYTRYFLQVDLMKPRRIVLYVCAVIMLFGAVIGLALPDSLFGETRLVLLMFSVPVLVILLIIALWAKARASYENQKRLITDIRLTVSDEGIRAEAASITSNYQWAAIQRSMETKSLLLLYIGKGAAIFINKSCLLPEELAALREQVAVSRNA